MYCYKSKDGYRFCHIFSISNLIRKNIAFLSFEKDFFSSKKKICGNNANYIDNRISFNLIVGEIERKLLFCLFSTSKEIVDVNYLCTYVEKSK